MWATACQILEHLKCQHTHTVIFLGTEYFQYWCLNILFWMKMSWGLKFIDRLMAMSILNYNTQRFMNTMQMCMYRGIIESVNKYTPLRARSHRHTVEENNYQPLVYFVFYYYFPLSRGACGCAFTHPYIVWGKNQEQHST